MTCLHVTMHAIERYQERVANVTSEQAVAAMTAPFIQKAADFGARYIRLGGGQRLVIADGRIITVLPKDHKPGVMGLDRDRFRAATVAGDSH